MGTKQRFVALVSTGVLAAGLVTVGAGAASARPDDRHKDDGCTVELDQHRGKLEVNITGDKRAHAFVKADFNKGDDADAYLRLDRKGEGETKFDIPRRANWVEVKVVTKDGRDIDRCDAKLRLDRDHRK
jgi:hypothetical protein